MIGADRTGASNFLVVAFLACVFYSGGCASRLTMENYERIQTGMSASEVRAILGESDEDKGGGFALGGFDASARVMKWESGDRFIAVTFLRDEVVAKVQKGL